MLLPDLVQKMSSYRNPTDGDILMVRHAIASNEDAIATLDSKINETVAQLEQLRLRKMKHQENVWEYQSLITTARHIPPEILGGIFELCAESGWARAPLVLSHVCATWRKAAEFPRVWSRVYIDCGVSDPLANTEYWLSRAQQTPLYITLDVPANAVSLEEILSLLCARLTQWRSIIIKTHDSYQLNRVLSHMDHPLPHLHTLDCATHWGAATAALVNFSAVHNAPALRELNIDQPDLPRWSIPSQLTTLRLVLSMSIPHPVQVSRWTDLLANLSGLKHLTLELSASSDVYCQGATTQVVELPRLESLTFVVSPDLLRLLDKMRAPALRKLHLRRALGQEEHDHISAGPSTRHFLASSPQIELLELHDIDVSRDELAQCFASLSQLEELRLHDSDISEDELKLLHGPSGLCPNLVRLDVRWCVHLNGSALVHLVKSRIRDDVEGGKPQTVPEQARVLEEVAVINCRHVKERDVLDIAQFTVCRLRLRTGDDFCRQRGCCANERYRQSMRLRHNIMFHEKDPVLAKIIL